MKRHGSIVDARGKRIVNGSRVRVIGVPVLSGIRPAGAKQQTAAVFRHIKGQCKRVSGFSRAGLVELTFRIRRGRSAGLHVVEIEPQLVLVQAGGKS